MISEIGIVQKHLHNAAYFVGVAYPPGDYNEKVFIYANMLQIFA